MSGGGNCFDNAMVETFFKISALQPVWRTIFLPEPDRAAHRGIGRYIDGFYNPVRRHSASTFHQPASVERRAA